MRRVLLLLAVAWLAGTAVAQPASDLLQTGIYNQETSGDLDAAIRIYRQILSAGPGQRLYAAQAQFRLGQCLLRKGDLSGAKKAFDALVHDYPTEKELALRAREIMPPAGGLLPPPSQNFEFAEYRWTIPGEEDGWSITHIGPSPRGGAADRMSVFFYLPAMRYFYTDADRDTMRPIETVSGPPRRRSAADSSPFELAELAYLLRRMPLATRWRTRIPLTLPDGATLPLEVAVEAAEDVTVPAGTFHCLRVQLSAAQAHRSVFEGNWTVPAEGETAWFGTGPGRPLVRMVSREARGELMSQRTVDINASSVFHELTSHCSFSVPPGWVYHTRRQGERILPNVRAAPPGVASPGHEITVDLFDLTADISIRIYFLPIGVSMLREEAESRVRTSASRQPNFHLRGGLTSLTLGGLPALSWTADLGVAGQQSIEYGVLVQSPSTSAAILVRCPTGDLEKSRGRFQPILDSFRMQ